MDEHAFDNAGLQYVIIDALPHMTQAMQDFAASMADLQRQTIQVIASMSAVPPWVWKGYNSRREMMEAERGRRIPDWEWRVMELQRRTFGSGNGRIMRD